jgi:hypothetical protein
MRRIALKRALLPLAVVALVVIGLVPTALAQEVTGGCSATVNGQTLDALDIKHPLVVAKGDILALTGSVPASAGTGTISSETKIFVEVVGDVPVAEQTGNGVTWGDWVEVPDVLASLAPGVYKVKGTATGAGWICTGSAYIKIEGGPLTAAAAIGAVSAIAGAVAAVSAIKPKKGQVFHEGTGGEGGATAETPTRLLADGVTLGLFAMLIVLVGLLGPSWVV